MCVHAAPHTPSTSDAGPFSPCTLPFWLMSGMLKCPVVGVCLSSAEQRKLVKKAAGSSSQYTPFELHEMLVSWTNEDNPLSRRVDALLHKKYQRQAMAFLSLNLLDFMKCWDSAFAAGDFALVLWAAASRPDLPENMQRHIFGCVHMAMHEALVTNLGIEQQLRLFRQERALAAEKLTQVKRDLARAHKQQRVEQQERARMQSVRVTLEAENKRLKHELSALQADSQTALQDENARLRREIAEQSAQLCQAALQGEVVARQLADALNEQDTQHQLVLQLKKELHELMAAAVPCEACTGECATPCTFCPRRILIVGGMTRMEALYRQLVEGAGGTLEYHNGNLSGGVGKLEQRLQRADMVLCPVNCNSHGACLLVKSMCKKHNKALHMMPNFSLNAVSRVIFQNPASSFSRKEQTV